MPADLDLVALGLLTPSGEFTPAGQARLDEILDRLAPREERVTVLSLKQRAYRDYLAKKEMAR